ncbi:MAG: ATP-binding cassette domain-containing protein [Streptococcaceae bacterium]|nr:ATP-binding cassette domain-containing protein [Streptococcaceae bacterium]
MTIAIQTQNIRKDFKGKTAVKGISLTVNEGEIFAILGPNGAGKSTLLRMLSTLTSISSGSASIFGHNVATNGASVRQIIGLTGQDATVDENLTALENLTIFGRLNGLNKKAAKARGIELLEQFSLSSAAHKQLKTFSGGMKRRLDLAVSLIARPKLVFLDEPTTGLDPRTRGEMWTTIRELVANGSTLLLTTQYLEEADQLADKIAIIDRGKLIAEGTPNELKETLAPTLFELSLEDSKDIPDAQSLITSKFGLEANMLPEQNTLSLPMKNTSAMTDLLTTFEEAHIRLASFSVRKPTLDEVFLEVTGN